MINLEFKINQEYKGNDILSLDINDEVIIKNINSTSSLVTLNLRIFDKEDFEDVPFTIVVEMQGDIMVEILLSYAILLYVGLVSDSEYKEILDTYFLKHPDNALLIELEWRTFDIEGTIKMIFDYCLENNVNYDTFGYFFISKLEEIYYQYDMDIQSFGSKMYSIWTLLPSEIDNKEPFWTLCYADDSLSWGDEKQTRELYQNMFQYYK